jgi:hypothetical protein
LIKRHVPKRMLAGEPIPALTQANGLNAFKLKGQQAIHAGQYDMVLMPLAFAAPHGCLASKRRRRVTTME